MIHAEKGRILRKKLISLNRKNLVLLLIITMINLKTYRCKSELSQVALGQSQLNDIDSYHAIIRLEKLTYLIMYTVKAVMRRLLNASTAPTVIATPMESSSPPNFCRYLDCRKKFLSQMRYLY
ncbi:hypothetical protein PUN28_018302 [Cardiocondyla obscurior]|uniref:Uncharacterized protein n=1 Tax=Cardiocondyla obscurior TaxID=286306 RepID=A0AAW2EJ17_9HYME